MGKYKACAFSFSSTLLFSQFCISSSSLSWYHAPSHPMKMELVRSESGLQLNYWPYANVRAVYVAH